MHVSSQLYAHVDKLPCFTITAYLLVQRENTPGNTPQRAVLRSVLYTNAHMQLPCPLQDLFHWGTRGPMPDTPSGKA